MRVAIIVPVYNERSTLPGLLDHLAGLLGDGDRVEALVVDGDSTDGSRELLAAGHLPWRTAPRGRATQMNAGAAATTADILLFLHADSRLPAGAIDAVLAGARRASAGFFRVRLASPRPLLRLTGKLISLRSRLTGIATGDQGIWATRRAFQAVGGYPEIPLFEDVEFCRRLRARERLLPLTLEIETSARRWERSGAWRTILRMWVLRAGYVVGVAPRRLARYYGPAR